MMVVVSIGQLGWREINASIYIKLGLSIQIRWWCNLGCIKHIGSNRMVRIGGRTVCSICAVVQGIVPVYIVRCIVRWWWCGMRARLARFTAELECWRLTKHTRNEHWLGWGYLGVSGVLDRISQACFYDRLEKCCKTRVPGNVRVRWISEIVLDVSLQLFNGPISWNSKCAGKRDVVVFVAECWEWFKILASNVLLYLWLTDCFVCLFLCLLLKSLIAPSNVGCCFDHLTCEGEAVPSPDATACQEEAQHPWQCT